MSGLLGLWRLDGAPVDPALLRRMADHMARRGPDGIRAEASGSLGMGFLEFRTLPGEAAPQPLMDDAMGCRLVFDGRLDNRDALKTSLEISGANPRETDLELIASAYRASPEDFPNALIGDFALALHDRQNNRLIAARDWLGQRPFYYFFAPGRLCAWSSEIAPLLELPEVSREPDEAALGEWLAACQMDASRTPFRDIQRLPPGHRLIVEPPASLRIEDWRRFEPKRELHFASDDEAAEAFREVFREAVACRLRAEGPVAIQASGGLDSSSVAAMARQIAPEARLETFAAVYPGVSACDESAQGRAVAEWLGLPRREVVQEPAPLAAYIDEVREFLDLPPFPNDFFASPLFPAMRESGARVCLTGLWGDHWLGGVARPLGGPAALGPLGRSLATRPP
jgi:asparagine synthase (glutamine-hydrolysing)